jgi:hypothetical protein
MKRHPREVVHCSTQFWSYKSAALRQTAALLGSIGLMAPIAGSAGAATRESTAGIDPDGLARIQRNLTAREYEASRSGADLQAPNRAHGLRSYFEPDGLRVHDRTDPGSTALLGLRLTGLGRTEPLAPVQPGVVTAQGAWVEIRRPGLVEWYVNSEAGLEQAFTLAERAGHRRSASAGDLS